MNPNLDVLLKSFDFTANFVSNINTIAVAILAVTVTLLKEFTKGRTRRRYLIAGCWIFYLVSVTCGILAAQGLAAQLDAAGKNSTAAAALTVYDQRSFLLAQIATFGVGTFALFLFGVVSLFWPTLEGEAHDRNGEIGPPGGTGESVDARLGAPSPASAPPVEPASAAPRGGEPSVLESAAPPMEPAAPLEHAGAAPQGERGEPGQKGDGGEPGQKGVELGAKGDAGDPEQKADHSEPGQNGERVELGAKGDAGGVSDFLCNLTDHQQPVSG